MITTPPPFAPAISVAIPMYNVEKFIGALLESLLAQTFQDFEVIIVDDCSTDNSCAVVENYIPKFSGRLKFSRMEKNSGGPGAPSNKAVALSRGKYVYVMDNDDLIVKNALEIFYNHAEKFNADVVYTDRGFRFENNADKLFPAQEDLRLSGWQRQGLFVDKPTLDSEDLAERVQKFCKIQLGWCAWQKLVRRDLLIENDITFPNLRSSADIIWTIGIMYHAKNFLRIPNPLYIYRNNTNSITRRKKTISEEIDFWMEINIEGIKFLEDWLGKQKFFKENPKYKFDLLEMFEKIHFNNIINSLRNLPPHEFYKILETRFTEILGESGDLISYLCTSANFSHLKEIILTQRIIELENKLKQLQGG